MTELLAGDNIAATSHRTPVLGTTEGGPTSNRDERLRFMVRLLEGEKMASLCREFGISRGTGYKIFSRYKDCGLQGLDDRSRAPYRQANQMHYQVERAILGIKKEHPSWGARKIRDTLIKQYPMVPTPAVSTLHAMLDRHGLAKRKKRR